MATGSAQLNFGPSHVANVPITLPPLHEQRAITDALSDVDALVAALERVIAKKRDLRQAAMQQLLTGQTRLPDYEWGGEQHDLRNWLVSKTKNSTRSISTTQSTASSLSRSDKEPEVLADSPMHAIETLSSIDFEREMCCLEGFDRTSGSSGSPIAMESAPPRFGRSLPKRVNWWPAYSFKTNPS